jgi:hypothetical protein
MSLENEDTCPICLNELSKQNVCTTICNHRFHTSCLIKYSLTKKVTVQCPLCRNELIKKSNNNPSAIYSLFGEMNYMGSIDWDRSSTGW